MTYEITKLHEYKKSQTEGIYLMIEMKEIQTGKWLRTYIVPGYRNYDRWRKIARLGNEIFFRNLKMTTENIINADSYPLLLTGRRRDKTEPAKSLTLKSLAELGSFG